MPTLQEAAMPTLITQETLKSLMTYDQKTGVLLWKVIDGRIHKDRSVGLIGSDGYVAVKIAGRTYKAHRLVWLYVHGAWPEHFIDHINGVRTDNRLENLRDVEHSINMANRHRPYRTNKSGFLGVCKNGSGWRAEMRVSGKKQNLGTYNTPEEAHQAYLNAKKEFMEKYA